MKTSLTTFENRIRNWLLDLLHSQWRELGVPFSTSLPHRADEVIDPEALLWCSWEFLPHQPRLREQVLCWLAANAQSILWPRIRKLARKKPDPKVEIWCALDLKSEPSADEPSDFAHNLAESRSAGKEILQQPGLRQRTPATVILQARDVLGADARHFILVYLLANPGGARLRTIAEWSGQSYRNISRVAARWESAGIITVDRGYANLKSPKRWTSILELKSPRIILINWVRLFDTVITLLRDLAKASARSIPPDGPVVAAILREAATATDTCIEGDALARSATVDDLQHILTNVS